MKSFFVIALLASCLAVSYAEEITSEQVFSEAFDLMARASSTSEVLALNMTNLMIIVFLGVIIIIGGAFFGLSNDDGGDIGNIFSGNNNGRSADLSTFSNSDLLGGMCFIQYTSGNLDKLSCVQRTACEDPKSASKYLQAGKLWHKMHKLVNSIPFNEGYESIMNAVQDASEHSVSGGDCSIYQW